VKARKHPQLLRHIQHLQGERPWGTVLDAGTGVQSIRWIQDLNSEHWTAVTGSVGEAQRVRNAIGSTQRQQDRIVQGNWVDDNLLKGEIYDTVIADYLLGAIEGFAPFFQSYLFKRLRPLTHNTLYVKGLEPYVPIARPETRAGRLIWDIGRFRDACVLLGGTVPYREYPAGWVVDHLQSAGFAVRHVKHFPIGHKKLFVNAQIDIAALSLEKLTDRGLVQALKERGEALRTEALEVINTEGALRFGQNYVIAAEPI